MLYLSQYLVFKLFCFFENFFRAAAPCKNVPSQISLLICTVLSGPSLLVNRIRYYRMYELRAKTWAQLFKTINIYAIFNDQSFNDVLTNNIISFEQLSLSECPFCTYSKVLFNLRQPSHCVNFCILSVLDVPDIDECTVFGTGQLCSQICINTVGSFRCDCREGYTLARDERTCIKQGETLLILK